MSWGFNDSRASGGETVEFSVHLDKVRLRVTDTDGRLVASVLSDLDEAFEHHSQLTNALMGAREHVESRT